MKNPRLSDVLNPQTVTRNVSTIRRRQRHIDKLTLWLILGLIAVATSRIVFGVPQIVGAALRAETEHDLGEPSTAQGPYGPHAEGDRILNGGALRTAEPSGSAVASQNPWKKITFSVYSDYYEGRRAADGSRFSQKGYTVACNDVPLGTKLLLWTPGNPPREVEVKVTDRLAKRFSGKRIDCSTAVWKALGGGKPGLLKGEWRVAK